ncbi:hypothetical protein CERZMDRAFT_86578 [Cercospora zeae-maydis SCOH1-5]|uniref:Uncharacterized protein n=1 Tax=Cercospora zeae-maydis SCOH1-5 TaxID=717836 RepID=A0A6A6F971_9PEZI|nr:hypothetical protein CERZMDRAFT_86578 [Cercospora zeae-maydis SCOH1-5]
MVNRRLVSLERFVVSESRESMQVLPNHSADPDDSIQTSRSEISALLAQPFPQSEDPLISGTSAASSDRPWRMNVEATLAMLLTVEGCSSPKISASSQDIAFGRHREGLQAATV